MAYTTPSLLDGDTITDEDVHLAAQISARYSQGKHAPEVVCKFARPGNTIQEISVAPLSDLPNAWVL